MSIESTAEAGGWRLLCASLLLQAVQRAESETKLFRKGRLGNQYNWRSSKKGADKEALFQRAHARDWIKGGVGEVTFEECCEVIGVDPDKTRAAIERYCAERKRKPLKIDLDLLESVA